MVDESWGNKHICGKCSTRFYDLGRSPITCPECGSRIETTNDGPTRRTVAASGLGTASVLSVTTPGASGVAEARVADPLVADEDDLDRVTIDDDPENLEGGDQDEEDTDEDGIEGGDEFELDEEKDPAIDDESDDEDDPDAEDSEEIDDEEESDDDDDLEDEADVGLKESREGGGGDTT